MHVSVIPPAVSVRCDTESDTERLGRALASWVRPRTVIGLAGPLGAGKTRLVRALAESLGVDPLTIASPTFVLIHEYEGRLPIYHFDTYRLASEEEFEALGASEYFDAAGVCLVEWADRVERVLPDDAWRISISVEGECRVFTLVLPRPERFAQWLQTQIERGSI